MNDIFAIAVGFIVFGVGVSLTSLIGGLYFRLVERVGFNMWMFLGWMFLYCAVLIPMFAGSALAGVWVAKSIMGGA